MRFVFERLTAHGETLAGAARLPSSRVWASPQRSFWAANFVWTEGDLALGADARRARRRGAAG